MIFKSIGRSPHSLWSCPNTGKLKLAYARVNFRVFIFKVESFIVLPDVAKVWLEYGGQGLDRDRSHRTSDVSAVNEMAFYPSFLYTLIKSIVSYPNPIFPSLRTSKLWGCLDAAIKLNRTPLLDDGGPCGSISGTETVIVCYYKSKGRYLDLLFFSL